MVMELEFVSGTVASCAVAAVCSGVCVQAFVRDARLTLLVLAAVTGMLTMVLAGLVVLGIDLGFVEAVSLSIVLGMSVDYVIHIAHAYHHSALLHPAKRTQSALLGRARPVLAAATTTIAATAFLLLCDVQLLPAFGRIVILSTTMSTVFALLVFPTMLILFGPHGKRGGGGGGGGNDDDDGGGGGASGRQYWWREWRSAAASIRNMQSPLSRWVASVRTALRLGMTPKYKPQAPIPIPGLAQSGSGSESESESEESEMSCSEHKHMGRHPNPSPNTNTLPLQGIIIPAERIPEGVPVVDAY
jgi:multidrug efflux pump subunit AcrB